MKRTLLAAAFVAFTPAIALAQSAMPDPAVPGSGYQVPDVQANRVPLTSAEANPSVPGDGYKIPEMQSATAPSAPVTNTDGSYPSRWIQN